ncbi:uncharacterized protein TNIN_341511 [Trichonephila inaurata madagascariensis]|uniref:Uncharacterized protein n=1 Tax=Trichonephila inaurata madagascariensis TaxID=2747483 RepID=A0A8X6I990_9ARAC|nr:uncharacterized protein TNIN_341511 [Trichonephila inaurata madagascariensis]
MAKQSVSMIFQLKGYEKKIEMSDVERKDFEYVENLLDLSPGECLEKQILKDSKHLLTFLDDLIQNKDNPRDLLNEVKALNISGPSIAVFKRGRLIITAELDGIYLKFQYATRFKLFKYRPTISSSFILFTAEVLSEFKVHPETWKIELLHTFIIDKFEEMHSKVKGIGPFNRLASFAINFAAVHFKTSVKSWLEAQIRQHMNKLLISLQMPCEHTDETLISSEGFYISNEEIQSNDDEVRLNTEEVLINTDETLAKPDEIHVNTNEIRVNNEIHVKAKEKEAHVNSQIHLNTNDTRSNAKETRVQINTIRVNKEIFAQEREFIASPSKTNRKSKK